MTKAPRTQAQRTATTRRALLDAGRALFAERGFANTPREDIVDRAGVTRGALHHHFGKKQDLFLAVFEDLEEEIGARIMEAAAPGGDAMARLRLGCQAFLDAALDPAVQRIVLLDAPAVLGWDGWREVEARHGLGMVTEAMRAVMDAGQIATQPVEPLAHIVLAALNEAALLVAGADDPVTTRATVGKMIDRLLLATLTKQGNIGAVRRPSLLTICSWSAVIGAALFVFWQLNPSLLFANTTPSGGDMGAHVWAPAFLRDHLLPHGRITGWTPDWYAGFPALTFYFPLPSLAIVVLDLVLPYGIAFKLITVVGLIALPIATYVFARLLGLKGAVPACVAVMSVPFLFDRSYTIYGGNIASTLAGEFSFSISLATSLLFLGVFNRSLTTGKGRALAAVLLAITGLCHLIPTFFAAGGAIVLVVLRADWKRAKFAAPVAIVAAMLGAFWWLPFLMRLPYTNDMGWERLTTFSDALLPDSLQRVVILAVLGSVTSVVLRRRGGIFLSLLAAGAALAFVIAPEGRLWNARLLPFWFLSVYLLAGIGAAVVGEAIAATAGLVSSRWRRPDIESETEPIVAYAGNGNGHFRGNGNGYGEDSAVITPAERWIHAATPLVVAAMFLSITAMPLGKMPDWFPFRTTDNSFIPGWVRWNYEGYERKASYPEYRDVLDTMERVGEEHGCGRSSWEYEGELDRLGTPMALMLLPYWTKGCIGSMEGLYFESSATTPFHFLSNSELSLRPPRPQRDLPYRDLDLTKGVQHLQLMGVRYYMALSDAAKEQARVHPDLTLIDESKAWSATVTEAGKPAEVKTRTWQVYEVAGSETVAPLSYEPVVMTDVPKGGPDWQDAAVAWFSAEPTEWEVQRAASGPKEWARVANATDEAPRRQVEPAAVSRIRSTDDRITFDVDEPGKPVLVKTSYFPNWQASGARGPWRVAPNAMVVIPTARHVELHYGNTPVDMTGWVLSCLGVVGLLLLPRRRFRDGDQHMPVSRFTDFSAQPSLPPELLPQVTQTAH